MSDVSNVDSSTKAPAKVATKHRAAPETSEHPMNTKCRHQDDDESNGDDSAPGSEDSTPASCQL